jgi:hypothetical protein
MRHLRRCYTLCPQLLKHLHYAQNARTGDSEWNGISTVIYELAIRIEKSPPKMTLGRDGLKSS